MFAAILSMAIAHNILLIHLFGLSELILCCRRMDTALILGGCLFFTLLILIPVSACIHHWLLLPLHLEYLAWVFYALLCGVSVYTVVRVGTYFYPEFTPVFTACIPLLLLNPVLIAAILQSQLLSDSVFIAFFYATGAGAGAVLAFVLSAALYQRLHSEKIPSLLQGTPLLLLALGITSLAFTGIGA